MQKSEFNKKLLLIIPIVLAVFFAVFMRVISKPENQLANANLAQEIPPEDRILLLAKVYIDFARSYPEFDKFTQEEIQPVCPLYVPDTETYRNCIDKILDFKMLTEGITQEKADEAEKECAVMILEFNTPPDFEPKMLVDTYNACLWYKLDR